MWYASPGNQGWGSKPASRKPSIMEADLGTLSTTSGSIKRSAGRVIRIINNLDHSVQVSVQLGIIQATITPVEKIANNNKKNKNKFKIAEHTKTPVNAKLQKS